ncbi:hypothetical protein A0J61_00025 [Choanephora cucurbitarum]|uniref:Uncharacterized protein n=1 Tax=Choanephora cucurbitarum TaxID=101091 RepID=A0A1C7NWT3_9FUNG|nr:hypothetical protein A0J61_00025 [Choanephora cucurbitarum]
MIIPSKEVVLECIGDHGNCHRFRGETELQEQIVSACYRKISNYLIAKGIIYRITKDIEIYKNLIDSSHASIRYNARLKKNVLLSITSWANFLKRTLTLVWVVLMQKEIGGRCRIDDVACFISNQLEVILKLPNQQAV